MGLRRAFLPLVSRRGFLLPSCQLSFYICICGRNAKGWNLNIGFSLLSFVIDFGVVTRFLIYSLAHIHIIPTFCSFVIIINITCHSLYSMPSDIHLMSFCIFIIKVGLIQFLLTLKCTEKTGWFSGSQERNAPRFLSSEIMILSSILTLLKINLSYFELFLWHNLSRLWKV